MAVEIISDNDMIAKDYEPQRQNRWVIGIDSNDLDAYTARSWGRPSFNLGEVVIDYINEKRFLPGKFEPQTLSLTLNDPISPSGAQKLLRWIGQIHEQRTGRAGYAAVFQRTIYLKMLDGPGAVNQTWELKRCWVQSVDFGPLDYTSAEPVNITVTLRYDKAEIVS